MISPGFRSCGVPGDQEPSRPDLSIIIVNRNTVDLLRACLLAVASEGSDLKLDIIVVDNGSTDGSPEMVAQEFPELNMIRNPTNTGFAIPNNQGLAVASGRHVMLLNSDTEVKAGSLGRLVEVLDAAPSIGAVGPALRFPDGTRQRSAFSFKTPWRHFADMAGLGWLFPRSRTFANQNVWIDFSNPADVDWLIAAALVVRREVMEEVGGLDERFRIHCNDDDWCRRIQAAGYRVRYEPGAEVMHHSGATIRAEGALRPLDEELVINLFDYFRKHHGTAGVVWLRLGMVIGYGARTASAAFRSLLPGGEASRARARRYFGLASAGLFGVSRPGRFSTAPLVSESGVPRRKS